MLLLQKTAYTRLTSSTATCICLRENGAGDGYKDIGFSVCEIKDLIEPINKECIYSVATLSKIYDTDYDKEKVYEYIDKVNSKQIKGVVALIDCHD